VTQALARGADAGLHAACVEGRAGTEEVEAHAIGKSPECAGIGPARIAVIEADRGAHKECADLAVPHDPAGGGEPVKALARAKIVVKRHHFEHFERDPTVPVHDRLGQTRGAR
jgi:hypothetical protein